MPKAAKETSPVTMEFPSVVDRTGDLDGYTVNFTTIRETTDLAEMLAPLPGGVCGCPHWGVVEKGRITVRYPDRPDEIIEAGEAFYMTPGHVPMADGGTEFVMFSPTDELAATEAAIAAHMETTEG